MDLIFGENRIQGFTLLEVTISTALAAIAFYAASLLSLQLVNAKMQLTAFQVRDELLEVTRGMGGRVKTLNASALMYENSTLKKCLLSVDGTDCKSTQNYPLTLYRGSQPEDAFSGPLNSPRRYSLKGEPCPKGAAASFQCPLEVGTQFLVQCKPSFSLFPPNTCPGQPPEIIQITFKIGLTSDPLILEKLPAKVKQMREYWGSITVVL